MSIKIVTPATPLHTADGAAFASFTTFQDISPTPSILIPQQSLEVGMELYLEAFWDLSTCRASGWGVGSIPWSAIMDYAHAYELDPEQTEDLVYYTKVLDRTYIEHQRKLQAKGK